MNTAELLRSCLRADRGLRQLEAERGPEHPEVAVRLTNLANAIVAKGIDASGGSVIAPRDPVIELARPLYVRAIHILERAYGRTDLALVPVLMNLATLERVVGDWWAAEFTYVRAVEILAGQRDPDQEDPDDPRLVDALAGIAYSRDHGWSERKESPAEAAILYEVELALLERSLGAGHPFIADTLGEMAVVWLTSPEDEEDLPDDADDDVDEAPATLLGAPEDLRRAAELLQRSAAILGRFHGPRSLATAAALEDLSAVHRGLGEIERADELLAEAQACDLAPSCDAWDEHCVPLLTDMSVETLRRVDASCSRPVQQRAVASHNRRLVIGLLPFPLSQLAGLSRALRRDDAESARTYTSWYRRAAHLPAEGLRATPEPWDPWQSATVGALVICTFMWLLGVGIAVFADPDDTMVGFLPTGVALTAAAFLFFWLIIYFDQPRGHRHV